jgi:hypothetical protein
MQRELLGQRITQFGVVINDQDFARVRHSLENPISLLICLVFIRIADSPPAMR